ncbi:Hypothetical predicted protein [Marmota monax]|uniref:Uncharacterized protein n=1 Tax=Marmota monax TaxID=9995 RepID=A0A5E4AK34_MARMO|nr:Hypothetical predicted protein [Marmota monax]
MGPFMSQLQRHRGNLSVTSTNRPGDQKSKISISVSKTDGTATPGHGTRPFRHHGTERPREESGRGAEKERMGCRKAEARAERQLRGKSAPAAELPGRQGAGRRAQGAPGSGRMRERGLRSCAPTVHPLRGRLRPLRAGPPWRTAGSRGLAFGQLQLCRFPFLARALLTPSPPAMDSVGVQASCGRGHLSSLSHLD